LGSSYSPASSGLSRAAFSTGLLRRAPVDDGSEVSSDELGRTSPPKRSALSCRRERHAAVHAVDLDRSAERRERHGLTLGRLAEPPLAALAAGVHLDRALVLRHEQVVPQRLELAVATKLAAAVPGLGGVGEHFDQHHRVDDRVRVVVRGLHLAAHHRHVRVRREALPANLLVGRVNTARSVAENAPELHDDLRGDATVRDGAVGHGVGSSIDPFVPPTGRAFEGEVLLVGEFCNRGRATHRARMMSRREGEEEASRTLDS
jgi:hypothetical protein